MTHSRNRLYAFVLALCAIGFGWLMFHRLNAGGDERVHFCFLKATTGLPCPACGTTRAVDALLDGQFMLALQWNPFGVPVAFILLFAPLWIARDFALRSDSFFRFYQKVESRLSKWGIALPLITLVLANWIWNYYKGY